VTRDHGDVEFFIWEHDEPRTSAIMTEAGYEVVDHPHPEEATIWRKHGQIVELYFNRRNERGEIVGGGRWSEWATPEGSLGGDMRTIEGVTCPVVSLECIIHTKSVYGLG
jgi:hypothetical protein